MGLQSKLLNLSNNWGLGSLAFKSMATLHKLIGIFPFILISSCKKVLIHLLLYMLFYTGCSTEEAIFPFYLSWRACWWQTGCCPCLRILLQCTENMGSYKREQGPWPSRTKGFFILFLFVNRTVQSHVLSPLFIFWLLGNGCYCSVWRDCQREALWLGLW